MIEESYPKEKLLEIIDEIRGIVGFPGTIALKEAHLTDSLPDIVRYTHRQWLHQMHQANLNRIELESEIDRLNKWIDDLQSGMFVNCVYCGHKLGENDGNEIPRDRLHHHIRECSKHPMSNVMKENLKLASTIAIMTEEIAELQRANQALEEASKGIQYEN